MLLSKGGYCYPKSYLFTWPQFCRVIIATGEHLTAITLVKIDTFFSLFLVVLYLSHNSSSPVEGKYKNITVVCVNSCIFVKRKNNKKSTYTEPNRLISSLYFDCSIKHALIMYSYISWESAIRANWVSSTAVLHSKTSNHSLQRFQGICSFTEKYQLSLRPQEEESSHTPSQWKANTICNPHPGCCKWKFKPNV